MAIKSILSKNYTMYIIQQPKLMQQKRGLKSVAVMLTSILKKENVIPITNRVK